MDPKPHAIDDVVQTGLEKLQQVFTRRALSPCSSLVIIPELLFQHAIDAPDFLFFPQLHAVVGQASAPHALLSPVSTRVYISTPVNAHRFSGKDLCLLGALTCRLDLNILPSYVNSALDLN